MKITVSTRVHVPLPEAWRIYHSPADIMVWNTASPDWHTTAASVDLRVGGVFSSRMAAKDGSFSFDFEGVYTRVEPLSCVEYAFGERTGQVSFVPEAASAASPACVRVSVTFDAEGTHSPEQQREGWQAILDNFARHAQAQQAQR